MILRDSRTKEKSTKITLCELEQQQNDDKPNFNILVLCQIKKTNKLEIRGQCVTVGVTKGKAAASVLFYVIICHYSVGSTAFIQNLGFGQSNTGARPI